MEEFNKDQKTSIPRVFSLEEFARSYQKMIATNDGAYDANRFSYWRQSRHSRNYTPEDVAHIIQFGSLSEQQDLSRHYFNTQGYYSQIIMHYATLLMYQGILVPNPAIGKKLSTPHIQKRYYSALDFVEKMRLPAFLTNCAARALINGCYYGVITETGKSTFSTIDLPQDYCRTRFKDTQGNDVIEFNLSYFDSIVLEEDRKLALAAYPEAISRAYRKKERGNSFWYIVPSDIAICFPTFTGRPSFLSIIPATIDYDEAVAANRERDAEEIKKIIVQKIPHLTDGRLVFEPQEAEEMHDGVVGMLKGNDNLSVLTTYGDVDSISSKTSTDDMSKVLERIEKNIYSQAGVSGELFAASGGSTLEASLRNDLAYMMYFANKFSHYITTLLNSRFSNSNISFNYSILPVSWHNQNKYVDTTFKLASSGYSLLLPALALGLSQKDFGNLKDLENELLKLGDKMVPPSTSYTQTEKDSGKDSTNADSSKTVVSNGNGTSNEGGRPRMEDEQKADSTVAKEKSQK